MRTFLNRVANPVVRALLHSPLHGLLSRGVVLITVTDRRSGRRYTLPVQYAQHGAEIAMLSSPSRRWWRNLEGGAPVALRIRGRTYTGEGEALTGAEAEAARARCAGTALERAARTNRDAVAITVRNLRPITEGSLP